MIMLRPGYPGWVGWDDFGICIHSHFRFRYFFWYNHFYCEVVCSLILFSPGDVA